MQPHDPTWQADFQLSKKFYNFAVAIHKELPHNDTYKSN